MVVLVMVACDKGKVQSSHGHFTSKKQHCYSYSYQSEKETLLQLQLQSFQK